jgi:hypothetical protein
MAIKSPEQRIATFNETRVQWAGHDSGLGSWVAAVMQAHPDFGDVRASSVSPPSGVRHKATSSISRAFTKQINPPSQSQPELVSQPSPAALPPHGSSPSAAHRLSGVKGKDLLQAAGALGGKGMTGAKGLFAKGRNRLRGSAGGSEKVD